MRETNIMKFFVNGEGGTSSLLATVLDPHLEDERQRLFRHKFCNRLKSSGVDLCPDDGPQAVLPEYRGVDLVMVWGDWILILENKVAAASITRGQLTGYYRTTLTEIRQGTFLRAEDRERLKDTRNKRVCIVFVTPTENLGNLEFKSLALEDGRDDRKVHLSWPSVLADLDEAFPEGTAGDPFGRAIRDARSRTAEILSERIVPPTEETDDRVALKKFVRAVRGKVEEMMEFQPDLKLNIWRDPRNDQLYGHIGGDRGNVYFDALADGVTCLVNQDAAVLSGRMGFKVTGKALAGRREDFCSVPTETWARILDLEPGSLELDEKKCWVIFKNRWNGKYDDLIEQLACLFCRFLLTFREFMVAPHREAASEGSKKVKKRK